MEAVLEDSTRLPAEWIVVSAEEATQLPPGWDVQEQGQPIQLRSEVHSPFFLVTTVRSEVQQAALWSGESPPMLRTALEAVGLTFLEGSVTFGPSQPVTMSLSGEVGVCHGCSYIYESSVCFCCSWVGCGESHWVGERQGTRLSCECGTCVFLARCCRTCTTRPGSSTCGHVVRHPPLLLLTKRFHLHASAVYDSEQDSYLTAFQFELFKASEYVEVSGSSSAASCCATVPRARVQA